MPSATHNTDSPREAVLSGVHAAIGIDVGATFTRVAVVDARLNVTAERRFVTGRPRDAAALVAQIAKTANLVGKLAGIDAANSIPVGLAMPGTLDVERRILIRSVNLAMLEGMPIGRMLGARMKLTPLVMTDADAATWGEYACRVSGGMLQSEPPEQTTGRPRPIDGASFAHLRIGTGVACGVVANGQLVRLDTGRTQHLEALVVETSPDATPCSCGRRGCLEAVASGAALTRRAESVGITRGLEGLQRAWEQGDPRARDIVRKAAQSVNTAVRNVADRWTAAVVCLGGGGVATLPAIIDEVRRLVRQEGGPALPSSSSLESARLGDSAGVIGAALLAARGV